MCTLSQNDYGASSARFGSISGDVCQVQFQRWRGLHPMKKGRKEHRGTAGVLLSSDLCSWVEEQEEKQQQVEHTCWKLVALQGLLTETEPTQGQRVPLSHWPPAFSR